MESTEQTGNKHSWERQVSAVKPDLKWSAAPQEKQLTSLLEAWRQQSWQETNTVSENKFLLPALIQMKKRQPPKEEKRLNSLFQGMKTKVQIKKNERENTTGSTSGQDGS